MAEDSRSLPDQYVDATEHPDAGMSGDESGDGDYFPAQGNDEDDDEAAFEEYLEHLMQEDDEDEDEDDEFEDADDGGFGVEVEVEEEDEDDDDQPQEGAAGGTTIRLADLPAPRRAILMRLLAQAQLGRVFVQTGARGADDDDFEDEDPYYYRNRRRRTSLDPNRFPKVPSDKGIELMESGEFGGSEIQVSTVKARKSLARRIFDREMALENGARERANQNLMSQGMIPSTTADTIIHYNSPVYSGQFSDDGNFFFAAVKDFKVRMYDTSNPYHWKYYKTVVMPEGQWTLTDASLSPDNKSLAYTSICNMVCLAPTDPNDAGDPYMLDMSDMGARNTNRNPRWGNRHQFGIWSVRWSGDGRELVVGTNRQSIYVYDIEARQSVLRIPAHEDDVNAVCFGDKLSPHILYSGSDDTTLKVWDRRSMGDSREAGAFVGHTQGLTYIDSKGDGRYILSNGKDQTMKLWDQRMMMSTAEANRVARTTHFAGDFDYRWSTWTDDDYVPHPHDNSLVTFRGHAVLRTLIRCHFSPAGSTNNRYVYSGSEDGNVWIYDMDATVKGKIDVQKATKNSRPLDPRLVGDYHWDTRRSSTEWKTVVRDASWHPNAPVIAASSWNGYGNQTGTVTVHTWNDGAEDDEANGMSVRVDDKLTKDPALYGPSPSGRPRRSTRRFFGFGGGDDDEDDE